MKTQPSLRRIALINPTKFLGNLLLAGGFIQHLSQWCESRGIELLVVLDESFRELVAPALPGVNLVYYPRKALLPGASAWQAVRAYWQCVRQIRAFQADLAFTIEEDSVCHRLTHFSGAAHKVSSTSHRYHVGFDQVLDIPRSGRSAQEAHIWHSFRDVFQALELPVPPRPAYMTLPERMPSEALLARLSVLGLNLQEPLAVLHAGASKVYKKWPIEHFVELATSMRVRGYQLALIGAGKADAEVNTRIMEVLVGAPSPTVVSPLPVCVDLCNRLSLAELSALLGAADVMVGNDSGPSHLASALGLKGAVIFGPTDLDVWRPLGPQTEVLERKSACAADCTRHHCRSGYACLSTLTPDMVILRLFPPDRLAGIASH